MKTIKIAYVVFFSLLISCNTRINEETEDETIENTVSSNEFANIETSECGLEDGTYSATVDYNNSETGYSSTYNLDVDVEDCKIVQINFPNGGYIDEDHITYAHIDENGNASVDGEDGKTYEVHIDN